MVDAEFAEQLAHWATKYKDDPKQELVKLLLLALEREHIVAVAYMNSVIEERAARLSVGSTLREVVKRGIGWAWRDEEMHAIYTRGILLQFAPWSVRVLAWAGQIAGAIGGWAAAVKHHTSFRKAPFSRTLASSIVFMGRLAGKVPRAVSKELVLVSFQKYCELQVQAEHTAARAWERIRELSAKVPGLPAQAHYEFRRMWEDEIRHMRLFEVFARSFSEGDAPRVHADAIIEDVRAIGEMFLPRALRSGAFAEHAIGHGGKVVVRESPTGEDKRVALRQILQDAGLVERVKATALRRGVAIGDLRVAIKASFMFGYSKAADAHIVDKDLLDELCAQLQELGCTDIVVGEGGNLYDGFFENRDVRSVAEYLGYTSDRYRIVDFDREQEPHQYSRGMAQSTIAKTWRDADVRIVFCKMRSHPVDFAHLVVGSMQGVGARLEEFLFAERFADRDTALLMPLADFPPHFAVIDAFDSAADGLVGVLGCRKPPKPRRLYAGADSLAVELVATRHMNVRDADRIPLIRTAFDWFGDPRENLVVEGPDSPIAEFRGPQHNEITALLSLMAYPMYAFASGRGAAFLPPMDRTAFPSKKNGAGQGIVFSIYRGLMQRLLGISR